LKKIKKKHDEAPSLFNGRPIEVEAGLRLQKCSKIAKFYDYFEDSNYIYLSFEYISGLDLCQYLERREWKPLSERPARNMFRKIVKCVRAIHKLKIYHRDLKLENIMITKNSELRIIDFGLALMDQSSDSPCRDEVGSMEYCTPELLQGIPYTPESADVYSLGVILYILLMGYMPFSNEVRKRVVQKEISHPPLKFFTEKK